jgi:hypothetical protein
MGARRDGVDVQTRVVSIFGTGTDDRSSAGSTPTTPLPGTRSSRTEPHPRGGLDSLRVSWNAASPARASSRLN